MDMQVLVAYATKYGATAEIAEKIGQVLRQAGLGCHHLLGHGHRRCAETRRPVTDWRAIIEAEAAPLARFRDCTTVEVAFAESK